MYTTKEEYVAEIIRRVEDGRLPCSDKRNQNCWYRDGMGKACVAGMLIKDEDYSPSLERKGCDATEVAKVINLPASVGMSDLRDLQWEHDFTLSSGNKEDFLNFLKAW